MRAWQVHQFGELRDALTLADNVPDPEPGQLPHPDHGDGGELGLRILLAAVSTAESQPGRVGAVLGACDPLDVLDGVQGLHPVLVVDD